MRGNILILCEDATFARMLELELSSMHFSVAMNAAPNARENDLILVDLDSASIPQKVGESTRIVGFTRHFEVSGLDARRRCSMILHRPFQMRVLREEVAHLEASEHREQKGDTNALALSLNVNTLTLGEATVTLRPKESAVMSCLLANRGSAVSREMLSAFIGESATNKTDVYVCYLRRKIETVTERAIIKTVRNKGYQID